MMKLKSIALSVLFVFCATVAAFAHSSTKSTSPADGAKLDAVPEMLHMTFTQPARVLKVMMIHSTADASHEKRLALPSKDAVEELHLTPEFMGAGNYKIEWRALGSDGHVIKGSFSFDVAG